MRGGRVFLRALRPRFSGKSAGSMRQLCDRAAAASSVPVPPLGNSGQRTYIPDRLRDFTAGRFSIRATASSYAPLRAAVPHADSCGEQNAATPSQGLHRHPQGVRQRTPPTSRCGCASGAGSPTGCGSKPSSMHGSRPSSTGRAARPDVCKVLRKKLAPGVSGRCAALMEGE